LRKPRLRFKRAFFVRCDSPKYVDNRGLCCQECYFLKYGLTQQMLISEREARSDSRCSLLSEPPAQVIRIAKQALHYASPQAVNFVDVAKLLRTEAHNLPGFETTMEEQVGQSLLTLIRRHAAARLGWRCNQPSTNPLKQWCINSQASCSPWISARWSNSSAYASVECSPRR
jgi:hypothetical protein